VRRGEPPAYFRVPPARPPFLEPPALTAVAAYELDARDETIARIDYYIKAVNEKFEQTMPEYQTVGQLGSLERATA
jgi:hypothetical protein